ncbi:MAG: hypothetical protein KUG75_03040, partial [Pseudomonadales bacterium]|nr:hypothetical protein [Pseudomonadales bacterium]
MYPRFSHASLTRQFDLAGLALKLTSAFSILLCTAFMSDAVNAAVQMSVTTSASSVQPSQALAVNIIVSNDGASVEQNLTLQMSYPVGLNSLSESFVTGPLDEANSCGVSGATVCIANEFLNWNLGTLNPGQIVTMSFPTTVASNTSDNTNIDFKGKLSQNASQLVEKTASILIDSNTDLTLAVDEDKDPVVAGDTLTYTLRYGNTSASSV